MASDTKQRGGAGEFMVVHDLLEAGFNVFRDVTDSCSVDLIAYRDKRCTRIQVKTVSAAVAGVVGIRLWKQHRRSWVAYNGDEFDVLALHVLDQRLTLYLTLTELLACGNKASFSIKMTAIPEDPRSYDRFLSFERCI